MGVVENSTSGNVENCVSLKYRTRTTVKVKLFQTKKNLKPRPYQKFERLKKLTSHCPGSNLGQTQDPMY